MKVLEQTINWLSIAKEPLPITKEDKIAKLELIKSLLIEEMNETIEAVNINDESEIYNGLADIYVVASNIPYYLNLDLQKLEEECDLVYKSNITKFCKSLDEAEGSQILYKLGQHPNKKGAIIEVDIHKTGSKEYPYILKTKAGKIMKSQRFLDIDEIRKQIEQ